MTAERVAEMGERIGAANAADPEGVPSCAVARPASLLYGRRMSAALV